MAMNRPGAKLAAASLVASVGWLHNWRIRSSDDRAEVKNLFTKLGGPVAATRTICGPAGLSKPYGGIVRVAFRSCFYTQFDELLPSPLLAMLLFGLLRIRVTN